MPVVPPGGVLGGHRESVLSCSMLLSASVGMLQVSEIGTLWTIARMTLQALRDSNRKA